MKSSIKSYMFLLATIFVVILLLPFGRANAENQWWSLGNDKYYSFSEFEQAWNKQVTTYVTAQYDVILLRKPTSQELQYWLSIYKENTQLSNKKNLFDASDEIKNGQEASDLNQWKTQARGIYLRSNCLSIQENDLNILARDSKWKNENAIGKYSPPQKDCHINKANNNLLFTGIIFAILIFISLFTFMFRKKKWSVIKFLKDSYLSIYLLAVALLAPLVYFTKSANWIDNIIFGLVGLYCLFLLVRGILKKRKSVLKKILWIMLYILVIIPIIGGLLIVSSVFTIGRVQDLFRTGFTIDGNSMQPTFQNEHYVGADKNIYSNKIPERGDVVIIHRPILENKTDVKYIYVKRIVGLPNDLVEIKDGYLWINGAKLEEKYVLEQGKTVGNISIKLSKEEYFVLGDNREHSADSREFGPIQMRDIIGKVK
jgi:signal peptidase I